jgi:hypothetical protein
VTAVTRPKRRRRARLKPRWAKAIAARHGDREVSGKIQAHMIAATG